MKRFLYNVLLIITALPLFGIILMLISTLMPSTGVEHTWGNTGFVALLLVIFLGIFISAYSARTKWLRNQGIFDSFSNFEAFIKENHNPPIVSVEQMDEFSKNVTIPTHYNEDKLLNIYKDVYLRLQNAFLARSLTESNYKMYIKCMCRNLSPNQSSITNKNSR